MKRFLKWLGIAIGSAATLAACAMLYLFIASELVLARSYEAELSNFNAPTDHDAASRGKRLATVYGCVNCHGADLSGTDLFDKPGVLRITAPNLTDAIRHYTDAEFERLMRHGIKDDGRSAWIMPSVMFNRLTDTDLGDITAYVRSLPARPGVEPETQMRMLGRVAIVMGDFEPQAMRVTALPAIRANEAGDPLALGRYLVMTSCTECHGSKLEGWPFLGAPNLAVAAAYSPEDFARLMHDGIGLGDRHLGLMSEVSKARFAAFTADEVQSIRTYLDAFARGGAQQLP